MGALVVARVTELSRHHGHHVRCITDGRPYPASEPVSAYINKLIVAISMLP